MSIDLAGRHGKKASLTVAAWFLGRFARCAR